MHNHTVLLKLTIEHLVKRFPPCGDFTKLDRYTLSDLYRFPFGTTGLTDKAKSMLPLVSFFNATAPVKSASLSIVVITPSPH